MTVLADIREKRRWESYTGPIRVYVQDLDTPAGRRAGDFGLDEDAALAFCARLPFGTGVEIAYPAGFDSPCGFLYRLADFVPEAL